MGAGGHAKVIIDMLDLMGTEILGLLTPDLKAGDVFCNLKILGDDSYIHNFKNDEVFLINGIGSLPNKKDRWKVALKMRNEGYQFASVIHPKAIIASDIELDEGVQIMAGVVIQSGSKIGKDTIVNTGVLIDHDCNIAENCHLAPGSSLCGGVEIGANTHIGAGSTVTEYVSIGLNCSINAGSLVVKKVQDNSLFKQPFETVIKFK
tara:strand:- start:4357 stop:4974 length:618 start_codon:yes stop_codon:yes gene_type:complete